MKGQVGFFDVDERLQRLSDLGDQPEAYLSGLALAAIACQWI
jgi:hypothetical protein